MIREWGIKAVRVARSARRGAVILSVVSASILISGCRTADQMLFARAEDSYRQGAFMRAESLFTIYLAHEPRDPDGWYNRALARTARQDLAGAMNDLDSTITRYDDDRDARWMRFRVREMQIEHARREEGTWTYERPFRRTWINALAVLQLEELTGLLERDPCDVRARCERGILWRLSGRHVEAYIDLTLALQCDAADVQSLTERGNLFHALGKYEEAVKDYDDASSACDTCLWLLYNKALSFRAAGRLNETVSVLETLVAADSTDGEAWFMLGDCRLELGRRGAACTAWRRSALLGVADARGRLELHCGRP